MSFTTQKMNLGHMGSDWLRLANYSCRADSATPRDIYGTEQAVHSRVKGPGNHLCRSNKQGHPQFCENNKGVTDVYKGLDNIASLPYQQTSNMRDTNSLCLQQLKYRFATGSCTACCVWLRYPLCIRGKDFVHLRTLVLK